MDPAQEIERAAFMRHADAYVLRDDSQIRQFYNGATIFVTGASGFLGKQLIEKLLRACEVKKIYVLLRERRGLTAEQRLAQMLSEPLYEFVSRTRPEFRRRVTSLAGDVACPRLGLTPTEWEQLASEVNVIFHFAATVRFNEGFKRAALTNVQGTMEALDLAAACHKLRSFVHVSTAYSNATRARRGGAVWEEFYPAPLSPHALLQLARTSDDDVIEAVLDARTEEWPNTYTFTKAVAEEAVRLRTDLPVCVLRPAAVISSYAEPAPGWVDRSNLNGASGLALACCMGAAHFLLSDPRCKLHLVPVDLVTNAALAAARACAERPAPTQVYHVTGDVNPVHWGTMEKTMKRLSELPSPSALWFCAAYCEPRAWCYSSLCLLFHIAPALLMDAAAALRGHQPRLTRALIKMYKLNTLIGFFSGNQWNFSEVNTHRLFDSLSEADQKMFYFDTRALDREEHLTMWGLGLRRYIIRDGLQGTEAARRRQFWFKVATVLVVAAYCWLFWKLCCGVFSLIF